MGYLFAAYAITFIAILGYTITLVRRRNHVRREAELLMRTRKESPQRWVH